MKAETLALVSGKEGCQIARGRRQLKFPGDAAENSFEPVCCGRGAARATVYV